MDTPKELLFRSTGRITREELHALYGELLPGDIVLKFAEYKNFDAARGAFQEWDESAIEEMNDYLSNRFRHREELYATKDKFIAMSFLIELISEWEISKREKLWNRFANPVEPQQAAEEFARRLTGRLPHIDIDGTDFTIDWRLRQLRETESPWNSIDMNKLRDSESGHEYLGLYDTLKKRLYDFDDTLTILPEKVIGIEIPYGTILDPVAVARELGVDINEFVQQNPVLTNLKAVTRPLSETGLSEMIEENLRKGRGEEEDTGRARKIGR